MLSQQTSWRKIRTTPSRKKPLEKKGGIYIIYLIPCKELSEHVNHLTSEVIEMMPFRMFLGMCLLSILFLNPVLAKNSSKPAYKKALSTTKGKVLTKLPATILVVAQRDGGCENIVWQRHCGSPSCVPDPWTTSGCGTKSNGECCDVIRV
jgi:hypothetical protein